MWVESTPGQGSTFHFVARLPRVSEAPAQRGPAHESLQATKRSLRVLLAEDHQVSRLLTERLLKKAGHQVQAVTNGFEALEVLEQENFDLVLMDLDMPEMDGLVTTARIRAREVESGRHLPIVALTAYATTGDRERCFEAGMDHYIPKPLRPRELLAAIATLFPAAGGEERSDAQAVVEGMAAQFVRGCEGDLEQMRQAIARQDQGELRRLAHGLAGAAGIFQATSAQRLAREIEQAAAGGDLAEAERGLRALVDAIEQLR
jgi:CheY-like chemotaxis protein